LSFEVIHKPTFTNQLFAIPKERVVQVLEKVERLREDPRPHGDLKKKLHGYEGDVYRLRSGDYRVLYTYGDGWVTPLGVDDRKDVYKGERLVAEGPEVAVTGLPDAGDILKTSSDGPEGIGRSEATASAPKGEAEDEDLPFEMEGRYPEVGEGPGVPRRRGRRFLAREDAGTTQRRRGRRARGGPPARAAHYVRRDDPRHARPPRGPARERSCSGERGGPAL
jgi:mRNA-degrading endonuclease RelE of RelBE toxin-antitoxin system